METTRDRLVREITDHVASHGLADASLRDLAAAVGTSHRMLHYHFGGRAGLVTALVESMEARQRELLAEIGEDAASPMDAVRAQWAVLTRPDTMPFVKLFFEVVGMALHRQPGTEGFLDRLTEPWITAGLAAADALGSGSDAADIRLGVAVSRGLLLDAAASGDATAATAALDRFLELWAAADR